MRAGASSLSARVRARLLAMKYARRACARSSERIAFLSARVGTARFTGEADEAVFIFRLLRYPTRMRAVQRAVLFAHVFSRFLITVNLAGPLMLLASRRRYINSQNPSIFGLPLSLSLSLSLSLVLYPYRNNRELSRLSRTRSNNPRGSSRDILSELIVQDSLFFVWNFGHSEKPNVSNVSSMCR